MTGADAPTRYLVGFPRRGAGGLPYRQRAPSGTRSKGSSLHSLAPPGGLQAHSKHWIMQVGRMVL